VTCKYKYFYQLRNSISIYVFLVVPCGPKLANKILYFILCRRCLYKVRGWFTTHWYNGMLNYLPIDITQLLYGFERNSIFIVPRGTNYFPRRSRGK
jgi:hypothetical protein